MTRTRKVMCVVFCLLATAGALAADGAATKDGLAKLYQQYFDAKDKAKLSTLVYWPGIRQSERDGFDRSLQHDLDYRLAKIGFVPLKPGETLDYSLNGVTFRPSLAPVCRMVATYRGDRITKEFSTSYLVGVKSGRYYITLASPVARQP